ncbi:MAG: FAD-dependent monooxygenase [Sandaracinaceae bacterium]|nr:FAD-dependent monooxygenase [Sandaracinaceae bacterium]
MAVVLGASMTGLMASAALQRAGWRAVVIERDELELEGAPTARRGVGQGRHNHNLTALATSTLARLFPGVLDELRGEGATVCDVGRDGRWYVGGLRLARVEVGQPQVLVSRPLLDRVLLRRLGASGGVELRDATDVCGLVEDRGQITGVRVIGRREGKEEVIDANLVVDASGRGSRTPRWLEELGFEAPAEDRVDVSVKYTTRAFRWRPTDLDGDRFVYSSGLAPSWPKGAVVFAVDGERWMILQFAYGDAPPSDLDGFRRFAASLAAPEVAQIAERCEPIGDAATYSFPRSVRRRYDRARMPGGLVVVGDALQSTNPSWGLGITSAAMHVDVLERRLANATRPSDGFHRAALRASEPVWGPVRDRDRSFDSVPGDPSWPFQVLNRLVGGTFAAATTRPDLAKLVLEVITYARSPAGLLRPDRVARSLWTQLDAPRLADPRDAVEVS